MKHAQNKSNKKIYASSLNAFSLPYIAFSLPYIAFSPPYIAFSLPYIAFLQLYSTQRVTHMNRREEKEGCEEKGKKERKKERRNSNIEASQTHLSWVSIMSVLSARG
jgi:hypothetical protein